MHRAGLGCDLGTPKSSRRRTGQKSAPESVRVALGELERYTQAWIGNVQGLEVTGRFAAATFEHDTAQLINGHTAPQLHTHAVIFSLTERRNGETRGSQERGLFQSHQFATCVYRTELASRPQEFGYEIERGKQRQEFDPPKGGTAGP